MERIGTHYCQCGCGRMVTKIGNNFICGHHAKMHKGWHHSEETKKLFSKLATGRISPRKGTKVTSEESLKRIKDAAQKRPPMTEETKTKIRMSVLKTYEDPEIRKKCGHPQIISQEHRDAISKFMLNAWQNESFREKLTGENADGWLGGKSFEPYGLEFNKELKSRIYERDNHLCQNPDCENPSRKLDAHHIDYNKQNNSEFNLISLCCKCHTTTNWNRESWTLFYQNIIKIKYGTNQESRIA
jgi:hypothetical protein